MMCSFGCGYEAKFFSKKSGLGRCSEFATSCPQKRNSHSQIMRGKSPWNKGETKATDFRLIEMGRKISIVQTGRRHSEETKLKISQIIKGRPGTGGYRTRSGKSKFFGSIYQGFWMDSSWELKFAKHLDELSISWTKDCSSFAYVDLNGKERKYFPDFFLSEQNIFVEIKGYWTDVVRHKISNALSRNSFKLLVLDSLKKIEEFKL